MAFTPTPFKLKYQLTFEGSWPTTVAFLGSGRKLAAGNQLGTLLIWDLPETAPAFDAKTAPNKERTAPNVPPTRILQGHSNEITRLFATADGKLLCSASVDRTVRIWPIGGPAAGKAEVVLDSETRRAEARRQGKKEPESAPGLQLEAQTESALLEGHKDWVYALGLSGDCKRLVSGDASCGVFVWDVASRKPIAKWSGYSWNWVVAASLSPDGQSALVSEYRYKRDDFDIPAPSLKLFNAADGKETFDYLKVQFPKMNPKERTYGSAQLWRKFVGNGLIATAFTPDGKLIGLAQGGETETGKVHILEADTGKLLRTISGHLNGVTDLLFTSDSKYLLSVGRDTVLRITQVSDGKEVAALGSSRGGQFRDWFSSVALSPDEKTVAVSDIAGLVQVWQLG